jgi:hypothetical protein
MRLREGTPFPDRAPCPMGYNRYARGNSHPLSQAPVQHRLRASDRSRLCQGWRVPPGTGDAHETNTPTRSGARSAGRRVSRQSNGVLFPPHRIGDRPRRSDERTGRLRTSRLAGADDPCPAGITARRRGTVLEIWTIPASAQANGCWPKSATRNGKIGHTTTWTRQSSSSSSRTTGLLSKDANFRLIVSGHVGVKEIERLIKKLELDKEILAEQVESESTESTTAGGHRRVRLDDEAAN